MLNIKIAKKNRLIKIIYRKLPLSLTAEQIETITLKFISIKYQIDPKSTLRDICFKKLNLMISEGEY